MTELILCYTFSVKAIPVPIIVQYNALLFIVKTIILAIVLIALYINDSILRRYHMISLGDYSLLNTRLDLSPLFAQLRRET